MKPMIRLLLTLVVFAFLCLVGWTENRQRASASSAKTSWEYIIRGGLTEQQLNELGAQGWELVAVSQSNGSFGMYFKRAK